jgi:hypothetical protein
MARLPKDTAAIKVVPDPAKESGTRSPGRLPAPSRPGPGLRLKGPRLAPALSALALPGGKMTAPRLWDGPKERRGKPPLHLPASARMGRAVRGKRSTTPSLEGKAFHAPRPGGALRTPSCFRAFRPKLSLRVLPHSSTPTIPSEALLRMRVLPLPPLVHLRLGPQRGSASRGRRPPGRLLLRGRGSPTFAKVIFRA